MHFGRPQPHAVLVPGCYLLGCCLYLPPDLALGAQNSTKFDTLEYSLVFKSLLVWYLWASGLGLEIFCNFQSASDAEVPKRQGKLKLGPETNMLHRHCQYGDRVPTSE